MASHAIDPGSNPGHAMYIFFFLRRALGLLAGAGGRTGYHGLLRVTTVYHGLPQVTTGYLFKFLLRQFTTGYYGLPGVTTA